MRAGPAWRRRASASRPQGSSTWKGREPSRPRGSPGWPRAGALEAGRLEGKLLKEVRLARGRLRAEAAELTLSSPPEGRKVRLTTPAYRVRAEKATFTEKEARLFGFLATPCPCGEAQTAER